MRGAARLFAEVGRRAHEQRPAVVAAEHAGEEVQAVRGEDLVDDCPARGQAHAARAHLVGRPDVSVGVQGAAVGPDLQLAQCLCERVSSGVGATCAQTRRSVREPSSPIVNAV
jgi:hypothetical protein